LLESISKISSDIVPVIHVQAKNKSGIDDSDIDGALQLVKAEGYEKAINILINTTQKFSNEAKKYADEKGIILINGPEFASLLVKYGIDTNILD
ncbi:MAG: restriction endonuclease, partial [Synergistaceae bacterium]|nr:restriction endonuclease [Synergistaceae bacterium]